MLITIASITIFIIISISTIVISIASIPMNYVACGATLILLVVDGGLPPSMFTDMGKGSETGLWNKHSFLLAAVGYADMFWSHVNKHVFPAIYYS